MLSSFLRNQLLYSHDIHSDLQGVTLVSKAKAVPLQDLALLLAKKGEATMSPSHSLQCHLLPSGCLKALWVSPSFFFILSLASAKASADGQEMKMGRDNKYQESTGCRAEFK